MDPALKAYLMQLSDKSIAQGDNPIESGTMSGIQAAKQSMGLDEAQKARARGMAFMTLGHHLAHPGHGPGLGGALKAFSTGILPAAQAYESEAQRGEATNAHLMQQIQMEQLKRDQLAQQERIARAKLEQRAREQEELQSHRSAQLGEMQGYHAGRLGLEERRLAEKAGITPQMQSQEFEGIPIQSLPKPTQNEFGKIVLKHKQQIPMNKRAIENINEMEKIFAEYPNIGDSFVNIVEGNDESIRGKIARQFTDKKTLTAIQRLKKLSADLNLSTVMGLPAKASTDLLKRTIMASAPNGVLTHDAFKAIAENWKKRAEENIEEAITYENAWKKGYIPLEKESQRSKNPAIESSESESTAPRAQTVSMQTPDGRTWNIPADKVEAAKARGAVEIGQ
jgi:hypothetical protein